MSNQIKIFVVLFFSFFILKSYAIEVHVQSSSKAVSALGFTVNGNKYGGMGNTYSKKNLPVGTYTFGIRVGGVLGKDVGCPAKKGKNSVMLNRDSTAILNYDGTHCTLNLS